MRKTAVLILVFIIFVTAALIIIQRQASGGKYSSAAIKQGMGEYEYDEDMLGMAISRVMTSDAVYHNFGKPIYPADTGLQYVWVYIKLINSGTASVQIGPDDFTLSAAGKAAVSYDARATESMQKSLKYISLKPGEQNVSVLIFPVSASKDYILHFDGPQGKIEKRFVSE